MKARMWDERGVIEFDGSEVKGVTIESGDYSILIFWENGSCDRADWISI